MEIGVYIGIIVFLLGIGMGFPLFWVFIASSFTILSVLGSSFLFIAGTFYHALDNYILMAIGFFILAGSLMASSGIAEKIVFLSNAIVGKVKGGMIAVGIVATLFLSALTGSSVPCISALIPLLVGPLEKYGYERRYTTAVLCCSSFLGYLIPPSVPVLIYCLIAKQSVAAVFLSTIIPGFLLAGGYMILNYFVCDKYMHATTNLEIHDLSKVGKIKALWGALPALGCPLVVLIGIYGGICTPNEAGSLAVIYTVIVGVWVYRKLNLKEIRLATGSAIISLGMVCALIGVGTVLARILIREGVAQIMTEAVLGLFDSRILILLMLNVLLLIMGMFIDGAPIMIIAIPLILPLINAIDMNLVQLGAVIIVNVGIGVITPPYAISIFVGSRLSGVPYEELVKPMMLYLFIVAIPVLLLTTYIPALSCWLPTLILGSRVVGTW